MTARRVAAALLVALVALVGCKKKPATDPATNPGLESIGGPPIFNDSPIPVPNSRTQAAGPSAEKVIAAFNRMADETNADKYPSLADLTGIGWKELPRGGTVTADATTRRADLDAAFDKYWAAQDTRPERVRQKMIRDRTDALTKQGVAPDQARQQAEKMHPPVRPIKVTTPTLEPGSRFMVEADVANGVKGDWTNNGPLVVTGSVRFTESFRIHTNGPLTVKLRGAVGALLLEANGSIHADLSELTAATVETKANGALLLRAGPSTRVVRMQPGAIPECVILSRGGGLKLEPVGGQTQPPRALVVSY